MVMNKNKKSPISTESLMALESPRLSSTSGLSSPTSSSPALSTTRLSTTQLSTTQLSEGLSPRLLPTPRELFPLKEGEEEGEREGEGERCKRFKKWYEDYCTEEYIKHLQNILIPFLKKKRNTEHYLKETEKTFLLLSSQGVQVNNDFVDNVYFRTMVNVWREKKLQPNEKNLLNALIIYFGLPFTEDEKWEVENHHMKCKAHEVYINECLSKGKKKINYDDDYENTQKYIQQHLKKRM